MAKKKIIKKGVKKFIEEGYKLKGKINEATKKRMRKGNLKIKSDNPEVQAMLDDVIGKPTKIGVVTTKKGVPIIKDARGNVNKELTKMAEDLLSGKPKKPKKMNAGGLARNLAKPGGARKGKGNKKFTGEEQLELKRQAAKQRAERERQIGLQKIEEAKQRSARLGKSRFSKPNKVAKKTPKPKKFAGGGLAIRGLGKAFIKGKK